MLTRSLRPLLLLCLIGPTASCVAPSQACSTDGADDCDATDTSSASTSASTSASESTSSGPSTETDAQVTIEPGTSSSTTAGPGTCGDGVEDEDEECDDGNTAPGDGCSELCEVEPLAPAQPHAGGEHMCVLLADGAVRCWGHNNFGQLGIGSNEQIGDDELPSTLGDIELGAPALQLSAGLYHNCALLVGGDVRCWGRNTFGQLGLGHTDDIGDDELPSAAPPVELGGPAAQVVASGEHSCALLEDGAVRCWGQNNFGQLGLGTNDWIGDDELPTAAPPVELDGTVLALDAAGATSCALLDGGVVRCWGRNNFGQLGQGHAVDALAPLDINPVELGAPALDLSVGALHSCALLQGGDVRCWGTGLDGATGQGSTETIGDNELPVDVPPVELGGAAVRVEAFDFHSCAALESGALRCWGSNFMGQLGQGDDGLIGDDEPPTAVPPVELGGPVTAVSLGTMYSCATLESGPLKCWGFNFNGQLGYGDKENIGDEPGEMPPDAVQFQ